MTLSHSEDHTECEEWLRSVHMKKRWLLSRAQRWDQREVHDELNMCWAEWFKAAYTRMIAVELGEEARKAGAGVTGLGCLGRHLKCQAEHSVFILLSFFWGAARSYKWILRATRRFWKLHKQAMRPKLKFQRCLFCGNKCGRW